MKNNRKNLHFREMPSFVYSEAHLKSNFRLFFRNQILPKLHISGYKRFDKNEIARHATHALIETGLIGACVADRRDTHQSGVSLRASVWDAIVAAGFARVCIGSEVSGKITRYRATSKLLGLKREWELRLLADLRLSRNSELDEPTSHALVVLHTGKLDLATGTLLPTKCQKQPISFKEIVGRSTPRDANGKPDLEAVERGLAWFRGMEDIIERINRNNLAHSWQAFHTDSETDRQYVFQPNPCLRQIHVGHLFRAVRLYSWGKLSGQNLPKTVRRTMLIDGEKVAELDFSGYATRMLYHFANVDPDPHEDVYHPDRLFPKLFSFKNTSADKREIIRDFVKTATNICWNAKSRAKAHSAIGKLLVTSDDADYLRKAMRLEQTSIKGVVRRLQRIHHKLSHRFFSDVGAEFLITIDGKIMLHILIEFEKKKKPALAIHDALVVRLSDVGFAKRTMAKIYRRFFPGHEPVIKRAF